MPYPANAIAGFSAHNENDKFYFLLLFFYFLEKIKSLILGVSREASKGVRGQHVPYMYS